MSIIAKALIHVCIAALAGAWFGQSAQAAEKFRISLDTNPSHVRNKGIELFVQALKRRIGDRLEIEVFPSAQLSRDRDVARALRQGSLDMAVPGTWVLDGIVPSMAVTSLPVFYGLSENVTLDLMDGKLGKEINDRTEDRLRVKVLGKWMNLGFSHFYSAGKPIRSHEDLKGLKIRISGGTANAERMKVFGGTPNLIAWPDVPIAVSSGTVDAVQSTHESIVSAKLWESGLKHAFEDRQWFGQYVPMISETFWKKQPDDIKKAMLDAWEEAIGPSRVMAAEAQSKARDTLKENGVSMVTASDADLKAWRQKLMQRQDAIVADMKIEKEIVDLAVAEVKRRGLVE